MRLFLMFLNISVLIADDKENFNRYKQEYKKGDATDCFNLGLLYYNGDIAISYDKALGFFKKACELGHHKACDTFKIIYDNVCLENPKPFCFKVLNQREENIQKGKSKFSDLEDAKSRL